MSAGKHDADLSSRIGAAAESDKPLVSPPDEDPDLSVGLPEHKLEFRRVLFRSGPVVPKLYKALQKYGSGYVAEAISAEDELDTNSKEYEVLQGVWKAYRTYSGPQLSELTHRPNTPWSKTWNSEKFGIIPTDDIQTYYRDLVSTAK